MQYSFEVNSLLTRLLDSILRLCHDVNAQPAYVVGTLDVCPIIWERGDVWVTKYIDHSCRFPYILGSSYKILQFRENTLISGWIQRHKVKSGTVHQVG